MICMCVFLLVHKPHDEHVRYGKKLFDQMFYQAESFSHDVDVRDGAPRENEKKETEEASNQSHPPFRFLIFCR